MSPQIGPAMLIEVVGTLLSSISRTNTPPTSVRSSLPSETAIFRTLVFTAVSSSSNHLVMRKTFLSHSLTSTDKYFDIRLKPIDIVVLKKLCDVVNVVPVIAKSDSMTLEEREAFKMRIKEEFEFHNLRMFPYDEGEYDNEEMDLNRRIKSLVPFAVVGSEKNMTVNGAHIRGRQNRWGFINVEDPNHCDFTALRDFLLRTHLQDLIETTSHIHYEGFRQKQLMALKENTASHAGSRPISPSADRELSRHSQRMTMNGY